MSQDNDACPSNLSSSTAASSAATVISIDDMTALQAAPSQVISPSEDLIGADDERAAENDGGAAYFRIFHDSSSLIRQNQPSQSQFSSQQPLLGEASTAIGGFNERQDRSNTHSWIAKTTSNTPIVDPTQQVNFATKLVTQSTNSNLSMRDMFEDDEAIVKYQQSQKVDPSNAESWFPLGDEDGENSGGGDVTPSCSSGNQTPQNFAPQKPLPSPPSTLYQMSFMQEHSTIDATGPALPLIAANAPELAVTGDLSAAAAPNHDDLRTEEQQAAVRAAPPTTNNSRRPVLYSAIGSLENASLHSWNKRLLTNAAKKASPFITNRKNHGMPSTASLLPPNQWVPMASNSKAGSTTIADGAQQPNSIGELNCQATSSSVSPSSSCSNSRLPSAKQQSLASVLAAAEEAARSASGSPQAMSPSTTTETATMISVTNDVLPADVPAQIEMDQHEKSGVDNTTIDANNNPIATTIIATIQPQHPILNSALRPPRLNDRARSEEQKQHKRPHSMWGLSMFDDKNKERHVTMEESPATSIKKKKKRKKKVVEMFRPSCDAYTPRINTEKRTIKYKPAQERRAMMGGGKTEDMGTLSRPNFRDALRRVAMIVHQHVVKIEHRVEDQGGLLNKGLFTAEMREAFSEERFVTPRYKCTMVRVPMSRPGMVYGLRKIKVRYEIPTESEIYEFAHRLFQKVQLSSECSIVGLIYVERLMEIAKVPLLADTWRPIFLCGLLLASKVWQDLSSWNIEFASVYPQFSLKAIHQLELQFLRMVKWDLYISSR